MNSDRYIYSRSTDSFTKIRSNPKKKAFSVAAYLLSIVVMGFMYYVGFSYYWPSPKEQALEKELTQMELRFDEVNGSLVNMSAVLNNIQERDADVYELVLGAEPIAYHIWHGGIGGHDIEGEPISEKVNFGSLTTAIEVLERKLVLQSQYLQEIENLAVDHDLMRSNVPSIRPIQTSKSDHYTRLLSGFGMRKHPVHKINKMHLGIDFPSRQGTPVVATGNGKVISIKNRRSGYGKSILVDHGFGYETLYAHMKDVQVRVGQKVERGEQIGTVGRTGTATAPHVHYEVRLNKKPVNPIHYCMDGLSPEEYHDLLSAASTHNHSFD